MTDIFNGFNFAMPSPSQPQQATQPAPAPAQPDISGSFKDTIKQIEVNRVLYGSKPGKNDPFKDEWPAQHRCCGGFTTTAVNRALRATGVSEDKLLPKSNLGTGQPKYLAEKFGTPLVNQFSPETLKQLGPGTVIAGTKSGGGTHAEMVVNHPVTGEIVVASYGIPGKGIQYKDINESYTKSLNAGRFTATNPFGSKNMVAGQAKAGGAVGGLQNEIMSYMVRNLGYRPEVAAGIAGNIYQESQFNPGALNKKSKAFGLFQHLGSRKKALHDFAARTGKDVNDWRTQVDFADYELKNDPSWGWGQLQNAKDPGEAAQIFSRRFERAGAHETNDKKRMQKALEYYQAWNQAPPEVMLASAADTPRALSVEPSDKEPPTPLLDTAANQARGVMNYSPVMDFEVPAPWQSLKRRGYEDAE